jgi:hypothetical protein
MKRTVIWFGVFTKRYMKRISFVCLLILLPALAFSIRDFSEKPSEKVKIAVYYEGGETGDKIVDRLLDYEGYLEFYEAESEKQLIQDVESKDAECGYVFQKDFEEQLNDPRKQIFTYYAPSSILHEMAKEVVFAAIMEECGGKILADAADSLNLFTIPEAEKELMSSYEKYKSDGSTFAFKYEYVDASGGKSGEGEHTVFPLKGILAVYLLAVGLFSAVNWFQDKEKGIFQSMPFGFKEIGNMIVIGTPVIWAGLSSLAAVYLSRIGERWYIELIAMILYTASIILFCDFIRGFFRNGLSLCCVIPLYLISCLLICPVFINISAILPSLAFLEKLYLPYYFITAEKSIGYLIVIVLVLAAVNKIKYKISIP